MTEAILKEKENGAAAAPAVPVIMPVYNAERYVGKALESVLSQRPAGGMEILCVDDGSTDNSGLILAAYASADPRICVLRRENGGPGAARNTGTRGCAETGSPHSAAWGSASCCRSCT